MANARHPRDSAFFTEYDNSSNPDLIDRLPLSAEEKAQRHQDVRSVGYVLIKRLAARRESRPLPQFARAPVERLSTLQLGIYRRHYPGGAHGLDLEGLGRAFLRFVHGDLRDAEGSEHGQPNGAGAFAFAEYASLACELEIDAGPWRALQPLLVQLQEVYVTVYAPRDRPQPAWRFVDYGMNNFDPARHRDLGDEELAALLAAAREGDPEARLTANLHRAFPGGVQL